MASTQHGIVYPVEGDWGSKANLASDIENLALSADSAIGTAIGATVMEANAYTDEREAVAKAYASSQAITRANAAKADAIAAANAYTDAQIEVVSGLDPVMVADLQETLDQYEGSLDATDTGVATALESGEQTRDALHIAIDARSTFGNLKAAGAVPDGATDSRAAIQNALDSADRTFILPAGTYRLDGTLAIPGDTSLTLAGEGIDATIIECHGTLPWLDTGQSAVASTTLTEALAAGASTISVSSASGMAEGQLIELTSTQTMPETTYTIARTHSAIITGISGGTVTLDRPAPQDMSVSGFTITANAYNVGRIVIRDLTISCGSDDLTYLSELRHVAGLRFENVRFYNRARTYQGKVGSGVGITAARVRRAVDTKFVGCEFDHMHYGVMPTGGAHSTTLEGCTAIRSRHISAPTGGAQNTRTVNCDTYRCYSGFDSHQTAFDAQVIGCTDYSPEIESKFRGRSDIIRDSTFTKGIEISNDTGVEAVADSAILRKIVDGCEIGGPISGSSWNRTVRNTRVRGYVSTWRPSTGGQCVIENVEMDMRGASGSQQYGLWLDYFETFHASDVRIIGPYYGQDQSSGAVSGTPHRGINFARSPNPGRTNVLERITIDGFDHGMNFAQGGDYSGCRFIDLVIRNCVKGINAAANNKTNGPVWDRVRFSGCETDMVEPNRWYYPPAGSGAGTDFSNARRQVWSASPPSQGTWRAGDVALATSPSAGGTVGWVCVTGGSPGTWKSFGAIDA